MWLDLLFYLSISSPSLPLSLCFPFSFAMAEGTHGERFPGGEDVQQLYVVMRPFTGQRGQRIDGQWREDTYAQVDGSGYLYRTWAAALRAALDIIANEEGYRLQIDGDNFGAIDYVQRSDGTWIAYMEGQGNGADIITDEFVSASDEAIAAALAGAGETVNLPDAYVVEVDVEKIPDYRHRRIYFNTPANPHLPSHVVVTRLSVAAE